MGRRFTLVEGTSSKFWEIDVRGSTTVVQFGRIGTKGQEQVKEWPSTGDAVAAAAKLITEKVRKGYTEEAAGAPVRIPPRPQGLDSGQNLSTFHGLPVVDYVPGAGLPAADHTAWSLRKDYDDPGLVEHLLTPFLAEPDLNHVRALVIGNFADPMESSADLLLEIVDHAERLANLEAFFLGDIVQEECEVSWIHHGDVTLPLEVFANLQTYVIRGGSEEMTLRSFQHDRLQRFVVETGGLRTGDACAIAASTAPSLRDLELWIGTPDYYGDTTVADLEPILSGRSFPGLVHLGLRDAHIADDIAAALAGAAIVPGLTSLDLSLGCLTDVGAQRLLDGQPLHHLAALDLSHHFCSPAMVAKLQQTWPAVDVSDPQDADEDDGEVYRYVAVGE